MKLVRNFAGILSKDSTNSNNGKQSKIANPLKKISIISLNSNSTLTINHAILSKNMQDIHKNYKQKIKQKNKIKLHE
jgi:hypothetical protein